jgi:hypothetical protein
MKIEEIKGYLGTGVKCEILNYKNDYVCIQYSKVNGYYILDGREHYTYDGGSTGKSANEMKLLLRPLSDLNKEITVDGETFVPAEKLKLSYDIGDSISIYDFFFDSAVGMEDVIFVLESLYKWHFDLNDLITKGQAIDLNTIGK